MYTSFFGFKEKPFNVTPDPRLFYDNPEYREVYANLLYAVRERKGFAVLTGEVGTGKTTLLRKLMDDLAMTARFVYFYHTNLNFEELLTVICEELKLQVAADDGRLGKIRALNEFLLQQLRRGGTAVLLIDEAQNLKSDVLEELRLLSNLETEREKLLQIILAGQPELDAKLNQGELRQLRQRISIQCRLDCLKEREVGHFVRYRLAAVDYKGDDLFSAEALRKIAHYSKGTPRLINIICDNALLIAYATSQKTVTAEIINEVVQDLRLTANNEPLTSEILSTTNLSETPIRNDPDPLPEATSQEGHTPAVNIHRSMTTARAVATVEPVRTNDLRGSDYRVFRICEIPNGRATPITLSAEQLKVLSTIDGRRDDANIAQRLNIPYTTVAKILDSLSRAGIIERVTNNEPAAPVPPEFFELMTRELTNALGPMARLIIQEELNKLGRCRTNFHTVELTRLVEVVSKEILHDGLKNQFRTRMSEMIRRLAAGINEPSKVKAANTAANRSRTHVFWRSAIRNSAGS